jgi:hypothetical protein
MSASSRPAPTTGVEIDHVRDTARMARSMHDGPFKPEPGLLVVLITCSTAAEIAAKHHLGVSVAKFCSGSEPLLCELAVRGQAVAAGM